jgi:alpha-beta hydrolase superfamily lysophospholipase
MKLRRASTGARLCRVVVFLAVALLLRCAGAPGTPDSFYATPRRELPPPGGLIRSEKLDGAPPGARAWKVLYASTGLDGRRIAVSGVVIAPDLPAPAAGRSVVAWAHPTTGVSEACAPSVNPDFFDTIPHLLALMALDDVVVATDYPGLGTAGVHPYLVGESEGRAVLDSVRAAKGIPEAGAGARFAVWGHSQGGQAALFAGQLARTYAPELALAGVAAIAPATNLGVLLEDDLSERAGRILGAYTLWSWSQVYGAPLAEVVSPADRSAIDRTARDCVETEGEADRAAFDSLPLPVSLLLPGALSREPWKRLLEENRPGRARIGVPIYVAQGSEDTIVRPSVTSDFVGALCRSGEIVRYEVLPGADHLRAARASATSAVQWMRDRLDGKPARNGCAVPELSEPPSGVPPGAGDVSSSAGPEPESSPAPASRRASGRRPR